MLRPYALIAMLPFMAVGCGSRLDPPAATSDETLSEAEEPAPPLTITESASPMEALMIRYLSKNDWQARARFVIHPDEVGPEMEHYYTAQDPLIRCDLLALKTPRDELETGETVKVVCTARGCVSHRAWEAEYFITRDEKGEYKIDWLRSLELNQQDSLSPFIPRRADLTTTQQASSDDDAAENTDRPPAKIVVSGIELNLDAGEADHVSGSTSPH